ncbi:hypothetical protein SADUNF_Sadunf17G0051000 [Salix dunnii]|uniref:Uncharacterized protein n=1 Tax=Salix dunnii TaxID=1413687 RepID=A0A835J5H6_9ROSI|nr:hypothetical protein SADUNF_Sadunf17G0051000 [Salix dunnii]
MSSFKSVKARENQAPCRSAIATKIPLSRSSKSRSNSAVLAVQILVRCSHVHVSCLISQFDVLFHFLPYVTYDFLNLLRDWRIFFGSLDFMLCPWQTNKLPMKELIR